MNKDIKIILTALIIIIIGAISFSYMNITGKIIKSDETIVIVSPKIVKANSFIYITVTPGKQGVQQEVEFYRADNDLRMSGKSAQICRSYKCFEKSVVKYKITDDWDNNDKWDSDEVSKDYYVRAYDIYTGKWVRSYFTIERFYEGIPYYKHH